MKKIIVLALVLSVICLSAEAAERLRTSRFTSAVTHITDKKAKVLSASIAPTAASPHGGTYAILKLSEYYDGTTNTDKLDVRCEHTTAQIGPWNGEFAPVFEHIEATVTSNGSYVGNVVYIELD